MTDEPSANESAERGGGLPRWTWPLAACVLATIPVAQGFSTTRIFHYRDLSLFFWPFHVFLRTAVHAGHLPLWDPSPGCGYPVAADPTTHALFLPTLWLRLLLPPALGFNLAVLLFLPTAALGAYAFFRRHASAPAAFLGSAVFCLSGPVVTAANMPNLSWSIAFAPWVFLAADRVREGFSARAVAALGLAFGLQALAGEPVTLASSGVLALAYVLSLGPPAESQASRERIAGTVLVGGLLGFALSAIEALPLLDLLSVRSPSVVTIERAVQPVGFIGLVAPSILGNPFESIGMSPPWFLRLGGAPGGLFASVYVGIPALALAAIGLGAGADRGWRRFWGIVGAVALAFALGSGTPVYSTLRSMFHFLDNFRFPSKYLLFASLALAGLATVGWDALAGETRARVAKGVAIACAIVAVAAGATALWTTIAPVDVAATAAEIAARIGFDDDGRTTAAALGADATRGLLLSACAAVLVWIAASRADLARSARAALVVLVALDLMTVAAGKNPTLDAALFGPPSWASAATVHGGRVFVSTIDGLAYKPYAPPDYALPPDISQASATSVFKASFPYTPSAAGIATPLYVGVPALRPREYDRLGDVYADLSSADRLRFLDRAGVATYAVPTAPSPDAVVVERIPDFDGLLGLYERPASAPRAELVRDSVVLEDLDAQIHAAFVEGRDAVILPESPPSPVGEGAPVEPHASVGAVTSSSVTLSAGAPEGGGFVLLRDAYDHNWTATVDGQPAPLLRANAVFRAVRIGPGEHTVVMRYSSRLIVAGGGITFVAALVTCALAVAGRRRRTRRG